LPVGIKHKRSIVIIGSGGHAVSVTNVAISAGMDVMAYIDDQKAGHKLLGSPIITKEQFLERFSNLNIAVAIGDNYTRQKVYNEYKRSAPECNFPALIHKSAVIGVNTKIGMGTVIMPLSNVGPHSKVGECCILNTSSSIDHDCYMMSFSSLAPRVASGGGVSIGTRAAISIGAVIRNGISIGDDSVIGANSYVHKSIMKETVAYGSPCKFVRKREIGEPYLGNV
jgi:sugar O-acyltransferase (sialic acid O-acetyltransferase NeuD family)